MTNTNKAKLVPDRFADASDSDWEAMLVDIAKAAPWRAPNPAERVTVTGAPILLVDILGR